VTFSALIAPEGKKENGVHDFVAGKRGKMEGLPLLS